MMEIQRGAFGTHLGQGSEVVARWAGHCPFKGGAEAPRIVNQNRASDGETVLDLGAAAFLDLDADQLEDAGEVDVFFDVIGGVIRDRSTARPLWRHLGRYRRLPSLQPENGRAVFFVVDPDRRRLIDLAQRLREKRLRKMLGPATPSHPSILRVQLAPPSKGKNHRSGRRQ